ncbi:hypothetical protein HHI36_021746 [Cryptolaemus montrouzieri]|uniref:MD-2-related lipid-recognition domain-containing protein n=1 Tax=Cryptolaemus montrouzieri TaxID=559131 RepID=A0ABD2MY26_9CUCU
MLNKFHLLFIAMSIIYFEATECKSEKDHKWTIQNVQYCPENDKLESPLSNLKYNKINASIGELSYDICYKRPLDENVGILLKLEKWTEKGWSEFPLLPFQKDVCRYSLKSPLMREMWIYWGTKMKVPQPDKCPIPAGCYSMENVIIDMKLMQKVPFWSGLYRFSIIEKIVKTQEWIYCLQLTFESREIVG